MSDLQDMFQQYLDMDTEERNNIAQEASNEILSVFEQTFEGDSMFEAYLQMFSIFCSADGELQYEEYELFTTITGTEVSYDDFFSAMQNELENTDIDEFFGFANDQGDDFMGSLIVLAICIFTCDGTLTVSEQEFIDEYFLA